MEASALKHVTADGLRGPTPLLRIQSDERLVALTRRGNQAAYEALVGRYQSRLLAFCRHMLGSREDAEDVLQEVFAAAFNAMIADERALNVRPWLYRIARNRSLNHLRRVQAIGVDSMDVHLSENGASAADKVHRREEFRLLVEDVQGLPETQRTALLLREIDALSYDQIAEAMETTIPSVKSLLVRARVSLAESAQARHLTCDEVRDELGEVAEGLHRMTAPVRRHLRQCDRCSAFRKQLRQTNRALAAVFPVGPLLLLKKLVLANLGTTASAGGERRGRAAPAPAPPARARAARCRPASGRSPRRPSPGSPPPRSSPPARSRSTTPPSVARSPTTPPSPPSPRCPPRRRSSPPSRSPRPPPVERTSTHKPAAKPATDKNKDTQASKGDAQAKPVERRAARQGSAPAPAPQQGSSTTTLPADAPGVVDLRRPRPAGRAVARRPLRRRPPIRWTPRRRRPPRRSPRRRSTRAAAPAPPPADEPAARRRPAAPGGRRAAAAGRSGRRSYPDAVAQRRLGLGREQQHRAVGRVGAEDQALRAHGADLLGREVHDADHPAPDELVALVVGDLRRRAPHADLLAEVDAQLPRRLARLGEVLDLDDAPDAHVDRA